MEQQRSLRGGIHGDASNSVRHDHSHNKIRLITFMHLGKADQPDSARAREAVTRRVDSANLVVLFGLARICHCAVGRVTRKYMFRNMLLNIN